MTALDESPTRLRRLHLLLQIDPGGAARAAVHVAALPGVVRAVHTTGSYDVIATVEAGSHADVAAAVQLVRRTPGLCALRLCRPGAAWSD